MARPVFLASYARWRQLREQYRRGLVPSDSGTGILRQCSHRRRPSSSRGMSYFVMTGPYSRKAFDDFVPTGNKQGTLDVYKSGPT